MMVTFLKNTRQLTLLIYFLSISYVLGASTPVPLLLHGRFDQLIQDVTEVHSLTQCLT